MSATTKIALGVASGYLLGRTKKLRLAVTVAGLLAGQRMAGRGSLLEQGTKLLDSSPELKKLQDQIRGRLMDAAKDAALGVAASRMEQMAEALQAPKGGDEEAEDQADEDQADEEPADQSEDEDASEDDATDESEDAPADDGSDDRSGQRRPPAKRATPQKRPAAKKGASTARKSAGTAKKSTGTAKKSAGSATRTAAKKSSGGRKAASSRR